MYVLMFVTAFYLPLVEVFFIYIFFYLNFPDTTNVHLCLICHVLTELVNPYPLAGYGRG